MPRISMVQRRRRVLRALAVSLAAALSLLFAAGASARQKSTRPIARCTPPPAAAPLPPTVLVAEPMSKAAPYQCWVHEMLVPGPPGRVLLGFSGCNSYASGCMHWTSPLATVALMPGARVRWVLYHELGHVFDHYVLSRVGFRPRFEAIERRPWRTPTSEERFADLYADCASRREIRRSTTTDYGLRLTPHSFRAGCAFIREAAAEWARVRPATGLG